MRIKIERDGETITLGGSDTPNMEHTVPPEIMKAAARLGAVSAGAAALPANLADLSIDAVLPHFTNEALALPAKRSLDAGRAKVEGPIKPTRKSKKAKK